MYGTKHRAWPPLLSLSNSIIFESMGHRGRSLVGLTGPLGQTLVAAVGMGVLTP